MKRIAMGLAAAAAVLGSVGIAQAQDDVFPYDLFIHMGPPSYSGCAEGSVADAALNCSMINPNGVDVGGFAPNFAWVIVGGVPEYEAGSPAAGGIGGIQFGVTYEPSVVVGGWSLCTGGSEIPSGTGPGEVQWPGSGSGNAITWAGGCKEVLANPNGMTRVGFFTINPGSGGFLFLDEDPRIERAQAADCDAQIFRICTQALGYAQTTPGGTGGQSTCGYICPVPTVESSWSSIKAKY